MNRNHQRTGLQRLTGWLVLVLHLGVISGFGQGTVGLVAALEGSHHVTVQCRNGAVALVLSHDDTGAACLEAVRHRPDHHHSTLVNAMLLLARPPAGEGDHVLALSAAHGQFNRQAGRMAPLRTDATAEQVTPGHVRSVRSPAPKWATHEFVPALPLLAVESVELLI